MKKPMIAFFAVLLVLVSIVAFADVNRTITFDADSYVVYVGKQQRITTTVEPLTEDAPKQTTLLWSTSDEAVARVNNGAITGVAAGKATITATAKDDESISGVVEVEVRTPVSQIAVEPQNGTLLVGANEDSAVLQLKANIMPEDAYHQSVIWSSSNEKVATVDADGNVKALNAGNVTITATSDDPSVNKKATCRINVTQAVTGIAFAAKALNVPIGRSVNAKIAVEPNNATNKKISWSSSDEAVAKVNASGAVQGISVGQATITAEASDGSGIKASIQVTVVSPVKKISFKEKKIDLAPETTWKVKALVEPEDATVKDVSWSSSNEKVATVDENGIITGISKGNANITATAVDGSGVKASISVKVDNYDLVFLNTEPLYAKYRLHNGHIRFRCYVDNRRVKVPDDFRGYHDVSGITNNEDGWETVAVTPVYEGPDELTIKIDNQQYKYSVYVAQTFLSQYVEKELSEIIDSITGSVSGVEETNAENKRNRIESHDMPWGICYQDFLEKELDGFQDKGITGTEYVASKRLDSASDDDSYHFFSANTVVFTAVKDANGDINDQPDACILYKIFYWSNEKDLYLESCRIMLDYLSDIYGEPDEKTLEYISWIVDDVRVTISYDFFGSKIEFYWIPGEEIANEAKEETGNDQSYAYLKFLDQLINNE